MVSLGLFYLDHLFINIFHIGRIFIKKRKKKEFHIIKAIDKVQLIKTG